MKGITIILSLILLFLSIKPCSDRNNAGDQHQDEISVNHNHQNDSDDSCPVTCICDCCGMSITSEPLMSFNFEVITEIPTTVFSSYQSIYRFDFDSNIWQPPQLIS